MFHEMYDVDETVIIKDKHPDIPIGEKVVIKFKDPLSAYGRYVEYKGKICHVYFHHIKPYEFSEDENAIIRNLNISFEKEF